MRTLFLLLALASASGCMSTKVQLDSKWDRSAPYTYEDYENYYLLGLVGNPAIALQTVCMDQKPYGVQRLKGVEDGLITAFTLGIYSPATVRVWCGD